MLDTKLWELFIHLEKKKKDLKKKDLRIIRNR